MKKISWTEQEIARGYQEMAELNLELSVDFAALEDEADALFAALAQE